MKNMMEYQGYFGSVNYNNEDEIFYGKVEHIRSLISYEGYDVESLKTGASRFRQLPSTAGKISPETGSHRQSKIQNPKSKIQNPKWDAPLKTSFHEAIDDYLAFCQEKGIEPKNSL